MTKSKNLRKARQRERERPQAPPAAPPGPTSWWFDFALDRRHVALFRFAFFAVLAVDAFLQVSHAPRYGAGDFNVGHLSWLPLPAPSRGAMLALDLTLAYLFALAAFGVATRLVVPLAALLDAYAYFASQLDSYQHHYLVTMLLVCASFVPWHSPAPRLRSWALRLFTVELAILYLWATIAKLDPLWLDGSALDKQLKPAWIRGLLDGEAKMAAMARLIVAGELALAVAWLWPRSWRFAIAIGVGFHVGVELAGFQIGQFSYVMLAIYTLMLPERIAIQPARLLDRVREAIAPWPPRRHAIVGAVVLGVALVAGGLAWAALPLDVHPVAPIAMGAVAVGAFATHRRWSAGAAHLAACLVILTLARTTDQAVDYYRYWGGSARRLGNVDDMRRAYRGLLAIEPDHGPANYYLGKLALDGGDLDRALDHFVRAQRGQPTAARGWVGQAQVHLRRGDSDAARAALEQALRAEPGDARARQMLSSLAGGRAIPEAADDRADD